MKKLIFSIAVLCSCIGTAAVAQETALVDPDAALPQIQPVVGQCEIVATDPQGGDPAAGVCITATRGYLSALKGRDPAEADQAIADLVLALAPLAQLSESCDVFDDEVAAAIREAAALSSSPDQQGRLLEISQTIDDCALDATAEVPEVDEGAALSPA